MRQDIAASEARQLGAGACTLDPSPAATTLSPWFGFAHDLGNLLQAATSAINIVDRCTAAPSDQVGLAIAGAKASLAHASELVTRFRERTRRVAGLRPSIDIETCLREIATVVGSALESGLDLTIVAQADLPRLSCEAVDFRNAVLNLIFNARAAIADDGRIAVRAGMVRDENGEPEVEISVADDGIGMSAATVERAFDPYFTTKSEGLGGIGLPAVEQFVKDARGRIWIESELGAGTIVRMRLPASSLDFPDPGGFAL